MARQAGPIVLEALTQTQQEGCKMIQGLFKTLNDKLRPQHETLLSLQYCKLNRCENDYVEELMGKLCIMAAECNYKEMDIHLKGRFNNGLNDDGMIVEIIQNSH